MKSDIPYTRVLRRNSPRGKLLSHCPRRTLLSLATTHHEDLLGPLELRDLFKKVRISFISHPLSKFALVDNVTLIQARNAPFFHLVLAKLGNGACKTWEWKPIQMGKKPIQCNPQSSSSNM